MIDRETLRQYYVKPKKLVFDIREDVVQLRNTLGRTLTCTYGEEILTTKGYVKAIDFRSRINQKIPIIAIRDKEKFLPYVYDARKLSYATCVDFNISRDNSILVNTFLVRKNNG